MRTTNGSLLSAIALWGQYRYDGRRVVLFEPAGHKPWRKVYEVTFVDPNRMIWRGEGKTVRYVYLGGYSTSIGVYDMDTYRITGDYFAGQAPGGRSSWCMSHCQGMQNEFGTPANSPWD